MTQLPDVVLRYVDHTRAGGAAPNTLRLAQEGEMQLKPGRWLPFRATHDVRLDRVEFEWRAAFPAVRVRDWCRDGNGGLEARLFGLIPVMRVSGPATARSEAMRYLAELPWFPQAIVANGELEWSDRAGEVEVATTTAGGRAHVTLRFDEAGDVREAWSPARPRAEGRAVVERPWRGTFHDYIELGGVRIPRHGEVAWELPDGPFIYFRGRVTAVEPR
jgi:hypothetical protein